VKTVDRRKFIEFIGVIGVGAAVTGLSGCKNPTQTAKTSHIPAFGLTGLNASAKDDLLVTEGFNSEVLIRFGDRIADGETFGFNNDYIAFLPDEGKLNSGMLWVNHEAIDPKFVSGRTIADDPNKEQVDKELYNVGGTFVHITLNDGKWQIDQDHPNNRRLSGHSPMSFLWSEQIGGDSPIGTLANCAGGVTPWGTVLTCEENFQDCFGDRKRGVQEITEGYYRWNRIYNRPPEHYGWVVEVDPSSNAGKKLVALGRCAHECATVTQLDDGRLVIYTGDDKENECLYKFVSSEPNSLEHGTLFVANIDTGIWIPIDWERQDVLKNNFKDQTEVLTFLREAADLLGGSKLDRPEDIEIDPISGDIFVALTKNKSRGNFFGSILKINEKGSYESPTFDSESFLTGGEQTGFACPDNLVFDQNGNLWFTSDISNSSLNKDPYTAFGNNGLFLVPRTGEQAGDVIKIASAPTDAEFTGPCFSADQRSLFLSVQHPGAGSSDDLTKLSSTWPDGGIPKPSVVVISGDNLERYTQKYTTTEE